MTVGFGIAAGIAAARGAARHRRTHPRFRQAQGAPRPCRRILHHRGRRQRQARGRLAAGRRGDAGFEIRRSRRRTRRKSSPRRSARNGAAQGIKLTPLHADFHAPTASTTARVGRVRARGADRDNHVARSPAPVPASADAMAALGADFWPLALARELDDAISISGSTKPTSRPSSSNRRAIRIWSLAYDRFLQANKEHWLAREIRQFMEARAQARRCHVALLVTLIEPGSCFAGTLAELPFASDRSYMLARRKRATATTSPRLRSHSPTSISAAIRCRTD